MSIEQIVMEFNMPNYRASYMWETLVFNIQAQQNVSGITDPLDVAKLIGDKLIRDTPFKYKLNLEENNPLFDGLHFVDFGRTFGAGKPAVAYAYTLLTCSGDSDFSIQIAPVKEHIARSIFILVKRVQKIPAYLKGKRNKMLEHGRPLICSL